MAAARAVMLPDRRLGALVAVTVAIFTDGFLYGVMIPLSAISPVPLGHGGLEIVYGGYAFGVLVATPVVGVLSDRFGRRRPMLWGWSAQALATLLFAAAGSVVPLLAARVLQGVASATSWTAGLALVAEEFPDRRAERLGVVMTGYTGGLLLGPGLGGMLAAWGGYHLPLAVTGLCVAVDGLLRATLLPAAIREAAPSGEMGRMVRDRAVLSATVMVALAAASWSLIEPVLPTHLQQHAGASPATVGLLFTLATLAYGLAAPLIGRLTDRWGRWPTMVFGGVAMAASLPLLAVPTSVALAGAILVAINLAYGFLANPTLAELAAAVDRRTTGAYASVYAIYNVAYAVGTIGSDVATAALASVFTFGTTLSGMSVALLASLASMHYARRTGVKRDESP